MSAPRQARAEQRRLEAEEARRAVVVIFGARPSVRGRNAYGPGPPEAVTRPQCFQS